MNNEGFRGTDETTATHAMDFLFSCCHELVKSREVPHCRLTSWLTFVILFVFNFLIFNFVYNQFASRSFRLQNTLHALHVTERKPQLWLSNKLKMHFSCYLFCTSGPRYVFKKLRTVQKYFTNICHVKISVMSSCRRRSCLTPEPFNISWMMLKMFYWVWWLMPTSMLSGAGMAEKQIPTDWRSSSTRPVMLWM